MVLIVHVTYPVTSMSELVGKLLEVEASMPLPEYIQRTGFYTRWGGEGLEGLVIYDIEDSRAVDGNREITTRLVEYTDIEGIKITSDVYMTAVDALAVLGKKLPGA